MDGNDWRLLSRIGGDCGFSGRDQLLNGIVADAERLFKLKNCKVLERNSIKLSGIYLGIALVNTALVANRLPVCQRRTMYFIRSMAITTNTAALKDNKIKTVHSLIRPNELISNRFTYLNDFGLFFGAYWPCSMFMAFVSFSWYVCNTNTRYLF